MGGDRYEEEFRQIHIAINEILFFKNNLGNHLHISIFLFCNYIIVGYKIESKASLLAAVFLLAIFCMSLSDWTYFFGQRE